MYFGSAELITRWARRIWSRARLVLPLAICVAASWFSFEWQNGSWSIALWVPGIYLACKMKWRSLVAFLLLTPLSFAFFQCAYQYAMGSRLYVNGNDLIWHPNGSIDRRTRIRGHNPGCGTRSPNEWVTSLGVYWGGKVMFNVIGPPPGAYTGPYPTPAEAALALKQGVPFQIGDDQTSIPLPSGAVTIDSKWLACHYQLRKPTTPAPPPQTLIPTAVLWKNRCMIVKVPRDAQDAPLADVYLIDTVKMQMIAMWYAH
jgi:hypothetical protein